jgi:NitT/TauT family transport system substrate-binding protein
MPNHTPAGISRRQALSLSGGSVLLPFLASCGWFQDLPVAVAAHVWVGYESLFMARDRDWLDPTRVTLHETRSAVDSIAALRAGTVQAAALTLDEVLGARATGLALSVVMVFNVSMGADMLLVRPGITQPGQLKGLRVGYEASSVSEVMLAEILSAAGLARQDLELQKIRIDDQLEAWRRREVDAFISYEPVATQLIAQGMTRLFDSRQIPNTIVDVLAVRSDALDPAHANALKHLIATHFRAQDDFTRNPQDAAYRMAGHLNLPAAGVLSAFRGLILPTLANNHRLLAGRDPELLSTARRVADILLRIGTLSQSDALTDLINARYLPTEGLLK